MPCREAGRDARDVGKPDAGIAAGATNSASTGPARRADGDGCRSLVA